MYLPNFLEPKCDYDVNFHRSHWMITYLEKEMLTLTNINPLHIT